MSKVVGTMATAVALVLSLTACKPAPPQPVTLLYLDLTGSTVTSRASTLHDFQVVLARVEVERGRLIVDAIDDNALAHARVVGDWSFRAPEAQGNRLEERKELGKRRAAAMVAIQALLDGPRPARSTDIFSALISAEQRFRALPQAGKRRLVLLSDMVSTAAPHNLLGSDWDAAAIDRLVASLRAEGLLPSMPGVVVWVGGAGLASGDSVSTSKILEIKAVWQAVFAASGATLAVYASQLTDSPESVAAPGSAVLGV